MGVWWLIAGFGTSAAGMILGVFTTGSSGYWYPAIWTAIQGAGLGLVMITATALALGSLTDERSGSGSALITVLRNAGMTLGPAVLGTLLITRYHHQLGDLNTPPIRDSVIAGVGVAQQHQDPVMLAHVQSAFVSGMGLLLAVCAALCLLSMALVAVTATRDTAPTKGEPTLPGQPEAT